MNRHVRRAAINPLAQDKGSISQDRVFPRFVRPPANASSRYRFGHRCRAGRIAVEPSTGCLIPNHQEVSMPRFIVKRSFPDGLQIPVNEDGAAAMLGVVDKNADLGVTWVHTYVS